MSEVRKGREIIFSTKPPKPIVPKTLPENPELLDFHPEELARQLTLIESNLYRAIKPWELLNQSWAKKDKDKRAPRVISMINRFNQVSHWVATVVVQADPLKHRIAVMKHIIEVCDRCLALNNFNAVMEIISGLQAASVYRLKQTRSALDSKHIKMLEDCENIMNRHQNFKNLRAHLHSVDPPCIPYVGMYLTDLTFIEDGNSDHLQGGLINFVKRQQVSKIIGEIGQYQHTPYNFETVDVIAEWCWKVQTIPEDECYQLSLVREPRGSEKGVLPGVGVSPTKKRGLTRTMSRKSSTVQNNVAANDANPLFTIYGELEDIKGYRFYDRDSPKNIVVEKVEERVLIKGGSLAKLVERLTFEEYPGMFYFVQNEYFLFF